MSGIKTRKRKQEEQESWKYERVSTALEACGFTQKYKAKFLKNKMVDDRFQKCTENFEEMDFFQSSIIRNVEHQKDFIREFKNTGGGEDDNVKGQHKGGRIQQPDVFVNTSLNKVKMEVDYVPIKAEQEDAENNDGEPKTENSTNKMSKLEMNQGSREKVNMEFGNVSIKVEPEEVENKNDGELEIEANSTNSVSKRKDVEIDQSKTSNSPVSNLTASSKLQSKFSQLVEDKIRALPLDKLTDDKSLEFILKELEIPDSEISHFKKESKEFIELIGGLSLALQQAVAFIKQEKELRKFLGTPYKIIDYVKEFKLSMEKFLLLSPVPDSSSTVFFTFNVTFEKIQKLANGESAIKILEILSFLYADKIPSSFLHDLVPEINDDEFSGALQLLEKYSMIKMNVRDFCLSLHRQLQFTILQYLKKCDNVSNVVMNILVKCIVVLKNIELSKSSDIFLNIHQIVNSVFDLIPVTEKFLEFMSKFGWVLSEASRYSESLELYQKVYSKSQELFGEDHQNTINSQHGVALQLSQLGKSDEALKLYREVLVKQEIHPDFGVDHPSTITTKYNLAYSLEQQEKYGESLELFRLVLAQRNKIHGENHPLTLTTQNSIALVHSKLGDFPKALDLYEQVEIKQIEILGPDHRGVHLTKHNKACVLFQMGKFQEASNIFNEVHEKRKEILGENHLLTMETLYCIGKILEKEGKLAEALDVFKKVNAIRTTSLGENHPRTINAKTKIEYAERKLRKQIASL